MLSLVRTLVRNLEFKWSLQKKGTWHLFEIFKNVPIAKKVLKRDYMKIVTFWRDSLFLAFVELALVNKKLVPSWLIAEEHHQFNAEGYQVMDNLNLSLRLFSVIYTLKSTIGHFCGSSSARYGFIHVYLLWQLMMPLFIFTRKTYLLLFRKLSYITSADYFLPDGNLFEVFICFIISLEKQVLFYRLRNFAFVLC